MIERTIAQWHRHLKGELPGGLDVLLHDDVVFYSPVVFTPQKGKAITKLYLQAAAQVMPGEGGSEGVGLGKFRYVKEVMSGHHAVLEFETEVDGKYVNGIDLITCDAEGKITEFKVMVRPLQAMQVLHQRMTKMLEALGKRANP